MQTYQSSENVAGDDGFDGDDQDVEPPVQPSDGEACPAAQGPIGVRGKRSGVWVGDGQGVSEGKAFTQKQTATFLYDRDEIIWKVTELVADGQKQDDIVARFRRIK